jgi:hypothetical protein
MNKLSKQEQEKVQILFKRALNQRQERLKRISNFSNVQI